MKSVWLLVLETAVFDMMNDTADDAHDPANPVAACARLNAGGCVLRAAQHGGMGFAMVSRQVIPVPAPNGPSERPKTSGVDGRDERRAPSWHQASAR